MTATDDVLTALRQATLPLDDDQLASRCGRDRHYVNAICRRLADAGTIRRYRGADGKFVNVLSASDSPMTPAPPPLAVVAEAVSGRPWFWEGNVQLLFIAHLQAHGWTVVSAADTESLQRGIDVVAERGGQRLVAEVKGWPGDTYARGSKAGLPKPTAATLQARHWFAGAVLSAMALREQEPESMVVIALPDYPRYRKLTGSVVTALRTLTIAVMLLDEQGGVVNIGDAGAIN